MKVSGQSVLLSAFLMGVESGSLKFSSQMNWTEAPMSKQLLLAGFSVCNAAMLVGVASVGGG